MMATYSYYADGYFLGSGKHLFRAEADEAARKAAERSPWGTHNFAAVIEGRSVSMAPIVDGRGRRAPF